MPVPTNVYTVMFPYYVDFGYYGLVIFSLILGFGWGMLYNGVKRKIPFLQSYIVRFSYSYIAVLCRLHGELYVHNHSNQYILCYSVIAL